MTLLISPRGLGLVPRVDPTRWSGRPILASHRASVPVVEQVRYHYDGLGWFDQGQTDSCVPHAWLHWLLAGPVTQAWVKRQYASLDDRLVLYRAMQAIVGITPDQAGSTSDSGARLFREMGLVSEWRGLSTAQDVMDWVLRIGPVCIGVPMYEGMAAAPALTGRMRATGRLLGYHEMVVTGGNAVKGDLRVKNSWGRLWARLGRGVMALEVLDRFMRLEYADAIGALEVKRPD